jgi:ZIP family zinc transporter
MNHFALVIILIFVGQILGATLGLIGKPKNNVLYGSLAFAASMMISMSLFELIPSALVHTSRFTAMMSFLLGIAIMLAVDKALPHINPELMKSEKPSVKRSVSMLVIGIALHNIPEGLAIGVAFRLNVVTGLVVAAGIAAQDVPENIATIIPLYALTKNRFKSFLILSFTVIFELAGFFIGFYLFKNINPRILGISLAAAAGFMTYISVEELIPSSEPKNNPKSTTIGFIAGIIAVALLLLFE